jgi:hypothetical protein
MKELLIPELSEFERLWLHEVYDRNLKAERFSFKELMAKFKDILPKNFRPSHFSPELIDFNGEKIKVLGVAALNKNKLIFEKVDKIVETIKTMLHLDPKKQEIEIGIVAQDLGITKNEASFLLQLASEYTQLYGSVGSDANSLVYNKINVTGNDSIYFNYMEYPGIETLLIIKLSEYKPTPDEKFQSNEILNMNRKLDQVIQGLELISEGQKFSYAEVMAELEEMKKLFLLSKKNWRQLLAGKLAEMVASGVIADTLSKEIEEMINPVMDNLLTFK